MPTHRIPRATLHEDLISLEREHESVVSMAPDSEDRNFYIVVTRYCNELETRDGAA